MKKLVLENESQGKRKEDRRPANLGLLVSDNVCVLFRRNTGIKGRTNSVCMC